MGEYAVDDQLPAEVELANGLGVSRTTLREAVGRLVAQGLLRREQGRGTYVRRRSGIRISMLLEANLAISDMIREMGLTPATSEVHAALAVPPEEVGMALGQPGLGQALVVRRVRTADGEPAVYSVDYLALAPGLPIHEDSYRGSVYELLASFHGQPVTSGHARVRAGLVDAELATKLNVPTGSLTLVLSQVHELADGTPVMFSHVHLRNDVFSLYVRRGSPNAAGPRDGEPTAFGAWPRGEASRPVPTERGGGL